jgi:hypothetical protein
LTNKRRIKPKHNFSFPYLNSLDRNCSTAALSREKMPPPSYRPPSYSVTNVDKNKLIKVMMKITYFMLLPRKEQSHKKEAAILSTYKLH